MTDTEIHRIILGAIIHRRRVDISMNQTELADRIDRTQSIVSRIERGKVSLDFFLARKIEEVLEFTARGLIEIVFERAVDATIACLPTATRENWVSEAVRVAGLDGFIDGPITFAVAAVLMEKWPRKKLVVAAVDDTHPDWIEINLGNNVIKRVRRSSV